MYIVMNVVHVRRGANGGLRARLPRAREPRPQSRGLRRLRAAAARPRRRVRRPQPLGEQGGLQGLGQQRPLQDQPPPRRRRARPRQRGPQLRRDRRQGRRREGRLCLRLRRKVAPLVALALVRSGAAGAAPGGAAEADRRADPVRAPTPWPSSASRRSAIGQTLGGGERFSPKLKGVPTLPLSHPNGPNLEQLASLDPDLVFSSRTWAKGNQAMEEPRDRRRRPRPALDRRRLRRHLQDRHDRRPQALRPRPAASDAQAGRSAPTQGDQEAPQGDADPRRRPHPLHLPAQQLGRRHRHQGGRRAADRRGQLRTPASSGSPTKSWSPKTRTSSSPSPTPTRTTSPA